MPHRLRVVQGGGGGEWIESHLPASHQKAAPQSPQTRARTCTVCNCVSNLQIELCAFVGRVEQAPHTYLQQQQQQQ